jgi:hypothetical protein
MKNENKIFNPIPETITIPENARIITESEDVFDNTELPPPPQISIID